MSAALPHVAIYADESCLGNGKEGDNPGGAGALLEYPRADGTLVRRDLWVSDRATTNNRMALISVIASFTALHAKGRHFRVTFTSDSRYLIDGMSDWVHGWARKGWKRSGGPIENLALWWDAIRAVEGSQVEWRWVRGHDGHAQNEYVNDLAVNAARALDASDGWVESGFEAWSAGRTGAKVAPPEPFPPRFGAARALPVPPPGRP
ncbi:MAG: ribonuclease HI [Gemmatimonadetes bacterium]|nr:ribonuclease HI [Gemmatimonadota bacterium]